MWCVYIPYLSHFEWLVVTRWPDDENRSDQHEQNNYKRTSYRDAAAFPKLRKLCHFSIRTLMTRAMTLERKHCNIIISLSLKQSF